VSFAVLLVGIVFVLSAALIAWWTLEPINRVAGTLQFSTRFMLTDFIGLMILLQAPLAATGRAIDTSGRIDSGPYWLLLALACLLVVILWMASVSVVSRAGITRIWRRLCVIVLLVPGTLALIVAWPFGIGLILAWISRAPDRLENVAYVVLVGTALISVTCLLRYLTFWSLVGSPGQEILASMKPRRPAPS
jgi:hypothetical protein